MNCSNNKCNKIIQSSFDCNKCPESFCSNKCLTEHISTIHRNKQAQHPRLPQNPLPSSSSQSQPYSQSQSQSQRSVFNPIGKILKDFIDDPLYNFKNFEFCRTKTNKIQSIGSGSFGNVYLSKNIKDNKFYAIKHIRKSKVISNGESLDIIYREISTHRLFIHDNLIRLYDHNEDEDNVFMIMEYAPNGTLFQVIRKTKGFNEYDAFKYFIQCVAAVSFLHENGFVHRDLKPENLLVSDNGIVKLCDFGWCVDASSGTRGTFCGTYEYMAPEIVQEIPYDKAIDSWSLGVLLYELLHGYSPFRAEIDKGDEGYGEIFKNIIKHKYSIEKDIGKACADLIGKLLTPDNNKRLKVKEIFAHPWVLEFEKNKEMREMFEERRIINDNDNKGDNDGIIEPEHKQEPVKAQVKMKENVIEEVKGKKLSIEKQQTVKEHLNVNNQKIKESNEKNVNHSIKAVKSMNDNIIDDNKEPSFSIFEDKVYEDTLKMIDTKKKRKVKNDQENDEIRISNTKNDFSLFNSINASASNHNPNSQSTSANVSIENKRSSQDSQHQHHNQQDRKSKEKGIIYRNSKEDKPNKIIQFQPQPQPQQEQKKPLEDHNIINTHTHTHTHIHNQSNDPKPSIQKERLFIEQTPTPNDNYGADLSLAQDINDNLANALDILEKAQNLKGESHKKNIIAPPQESFWDKFFAPFKCGSNNP